MHRNGYRGRKFGRERDQRRALMRGLTRSLFIYTSIETTLPKAKELRPVAEKLISKAKKGDLANRRAVIAALGNDVATGNRLVDAIAPQIARGSGYLRITRSDKFRVGDHTELATIEFVDDIKDLKKGEKAVKAAEVKQPDVKAEATKSAASPDKREKK